MEQTNLMAIFLTGLLTGGLTCMAVQGGLLAATMAQRTQDRLKNNLAKKGHAFPILIFLGAKLVAYTILGFLLGWLGSFFQLSIQTQVIMQLAVAVFMIATALSLLNVHPVFRYFLIQPPRFLTRIIRKESKSKDLFAPAVLGFLTIFIPCGTTQAMMALSIVSSNPLTGALILFAFTLGTSPVFFLLGYFTTKLGDVLQARFTKVVATLIILLALLNINNALALGGSRVTLQTIGEEINCVIAFCEKQAQATALVSKGEVTITIDERGYSPDLLLVEKGSHITLKLVNNGGGGCAAAFTIPSLGVQKIVREGVVETVSFTAPNETGEIPFMCSMGMYRGNIKVI